MGELTNIKVIAIVVLLVIALAFGVLPIFIITRSSSLRNPEQRIRIQRIIGCLNAFAGGVFMGIALIHLLPEVRTLILEAFELKGKEYTFNWAELCVACGFFMVVFVEQMTQMCLERMADDIPEEEIPFASEEHGAATYTDESSEPPQASSVDHDDKVAQQSKLVDSHEVKKRRLSRNSTKSMDISSSRSSVACSIRSLTLDGFVEGHLTSGRAVILLISLSLHSIFEGLALGLQLSKQDLIDIFIAIALHKGIEAFTIAMGFVQTTSTKLVKYLSMISFAFMSPIGIAIGIAIVLVDGGLNARSIMINGVLQGLATGTFMFVTFIEILPHELNSKKDKLIKFVCIIVGFCAITLLSALE